MIDNKNANEWTAKGTQEYWWTWYIYKNEEELALCVDQNIAFEIIRSVNAIQQVDEFLMLRHLSVKDNDYRKALHDLVSLELSIQRMKQK